MLFILQVAGSLIATRVINRRLAEMPEYSGHVGAVHVIPWGGRVTAHDFMLWQRGHEADGPIVTARRAALDFRVLALLQGKLSGKAELQAVEVLWVREGPIEETERGKEAEERVRQQRLGEVRRWQQRLRESFPLELARLELIGGKVRVEDRTEGASSSVELTGLHLVMTDLSTRPEGAADRPAEAQMQATVAGSGRLLVSIRADPTAETPDFAARLELRDLPLPAVRDFVRSAAQVDVTAGTFEVFIEADAAEGRYQGYVKPFFRDLEFEPVDRNPVKRMAGEVVDAVTSLLKNEEEKVATKAPFEGNFADNKVDVWTTAENLLRNAFVQSLREGLEGEG